PPGGSSGRVAFRYFVPDAGSSGTNSNYIGIDEFSYESVLPVTLFNFRGEIKNNQALLSWSTANEINNKGFEVEQSHDNKTFSSIGFVSAVKTSTGVNNYSFTSSELLSGANYYRLKQVDNDGASRLSSVVKLDFSKFAWAIFGNPSNNTFIQLQTEAQSNVAVQIVTLNGQLIQTIRKGNLSQGTYNIPLNLSNAPHGIYIVKLLVDKNSYTKKLIK
ncbi:MAG TPA: T9SS type A sorting domain-containing protein, partial [Parafilimonas sp.]|nr:T9SS type A sorting domain-containing protein [Parafilimonas sp.]